MSFDAVLDGATQAHAAAARPTAVPEIEVTNAVAFLDWAVRERGVLLHGTNWAVDGAIEPGEASIPPSRPGVQATDDAQWALFLAITNRDATGFRSVRNGVYSLSPDGARRHRYFSVNHEVDGRRLFVPGSVYLVPRDGFERDKKRFALLHPHRWVATGPVTPVARLSVTPADFPEIETIARHQVGEFFGKTVLRAYNLRQHSRSLAL